MRFHGTGLNAPPCGGRPWVLMDKKLIVFVGLVLAGVEARCGAAQTNASTYRAACARTRGSCCSGTMASNWVQTFKA